MLTLSRKHPSLRPVCRNLVVSDRRTSMALEPAYWADLRAIDDREGLTLNELCTIIDRRRRGASLTASVRVFVVSYLRTATPPAPATPHTDQPSPLVRAAMQDVG